MRSRLFAAVTFALVLAAAPLLAQSSSDQSQTKASDTALHQVTGTIASLNGSMLEVNVESAPGEPESLASTMVGSIVSFTLDPNVKRPAELRNGDRVDVWFANKNGERIVSRIDTAAANSSSANKPSTDSAPVPSSDTTGSAPVADPSTQQSSAPMASTSTAPADQQPVPAAGQQPGDSTSTSQAAPKAKRLPQTASSLPLIGLIGLAALGVAGVLRFAARV
jgi:hypothetical protein